MPGIQTKQEKITSQLLSALPSISYESGKLIFACETTGAKCHYTITDTDIKSDALSENGEVSLSAAYHISVYATADGYKASDKAEATLYWINANLDNGTNINQVRTRGVVASAHDGIVTLSLSLDLIMAKW